MISFIGFVSIGISYVLLFLAQDIGHQVNLTF